VGPPGERGGAILGEHFHRLALAFLLGGGATAFAAGYLLSRLPDTRASRAAVLAAAGAVAILPPLSTLYPSRITYARFGATVFGLLPIPALDITVGPRGGLGFREKSHRVTRAEVEGLIGPGVEIVVIGTGWDGVVTVDADVRRIPGVDVRALPTPEAYRLYNRLRSEGRRVVLLAHSTC
jgi:hypothetical protein